MKLPTLEQAAAAIDALAGAGQTVAAARDLVEIVTDLFADKPADQFELRARYKEARARTDAALDNLDEAIAERRSKP